MNGQTRYDSDLLWTVVFVTGFILMLILRQ